MLCMFGLDGAGKTTLLYQWALKKAVAVSSTIGFEYETVLYKDTQYTIWESGGDDKIRNLWRHHFEGLDGIIYVVDSSDTARMEENRNELWMMMENEDLKDVLLLVIANKQDKAGALSSAEVAEKLKLHNIIGRDWFIQGTCATSNDGVFTALDWIQFQLE